MVLLDNAVLPLTVGRICSIDVIADIVVLLLDTLGSTGDRLLSGYLIPIGLATAGSAVPHFFFIYIQQIYYYTIRND